MKSMIGKLLTQWHTYRQNNKGMTFVEVICAVAIFALVSSTIGGIIVFSARTYRKGISETSVQQEAQFAANNIGNIVKDACSVLYGENGGSLIKNGVDDTGESTEAGMTELSFITNKNNGAEMQYSILYDPDSKTLTYEEINRSTAVSSGRQIMAQNIEEFKADTADFKNTRTVKLTITVKDESTGRTVPMAYTMTSRNEVSEDITFVSSSNDPVIIFIESDLVLVPGETYRIPISVVGKLSQGLEPGGGTTGVDVGTITKEYVEVTVPKETTADSGYVQIQTKDKKEDGTTPKAQNGTTIRIRRVDDIKVTYAVNLNDAESGAYESNGAQYIFYANVSGSNLAKSPGSSWDSGYKVAQAASWKYELVAGGGIYTASTYVDETDKKVKVNADAGMEGYLEFLEGMEDVDKPMLRLKLVQDMPDDFVLTVTATSKHTDGVNKADSKYPDDARNASGSVVISARLAKTITLEPNETGAVQLNLKGNWVTESDTVELKLKGNSNKTGTMAMYNADEDKVYIKLANDETGGQDGAGRYTFTVDVWARGTKRSIITVHIRRLDQIWVQIIQDPKVAKTYDFRARLNVPQDTANDPATTQYLYDVMYDESLDLAARKQIVSQTLASRITWEYYDYSKDKNNPRHRDSVICMGGVGEKGAIIGSYNSEYDEYVIVNTSSSKKKESDAIKPARIEQDASGNWFIKQYPEIDLSLKDSSGKLPGNTELKVTIEMLHPQGIVDGVTNRTGIAYHDMDIKNGTGEWIVYASASITGGGNSYVVADGFQRADEWNFASNEKPANAGDKSSIPAIRTACFFDGVYNSTQRSFFRYKEHGTEWDASNMQYHMMDSQGERDAFFSGNLGSRLFLPDKEYDLEIVNVVYSENANGGHKYIYWPQDESLLEAGRGWKEEGFSLWDGTWGYGGGGNGPKYQDAYELVKNTPQMSYNYLIPRSEVFFERVVKYENEGDRPGWDKDIYETIPERTQTIGSQANPFAIKNVMSDPWDWNNGGRHLLFRLAPTAFNIEKTQEHFTAQIDRLENGVWVPMETLTNNNSLSRDKYNWTMQVSVPVFNIYQVGKQVSDTYRIRCIVTNMEWTRIAGKLLDPSDSRYTKYKVDVVNVYDGETGVVYLKLN